MDRTIMVIFSVVEVVLFAASVFVFMLLLKQRKKPIEEKKRTKHFTYGDIALEATLEENEIEYTEDMTNLANQIISYFEAEKPYLNPNLRVEDVARVINIHPHTLSLAIKTMMDKSFNQLVNWYRVNDAIEIYKKEGYVIRENLYKRLGFNSINRYNFAFSYFMGKTPAVWYREYQKSQQSTENQED